MQIQIDSRISSVCTRIFSPHRGSALIFRLLLQFFNLQDNHLTTRPSGSVHEMENTSFLTPAGPVLSTPGVAKSPLSSEDTKCACECSSISRSVNFAMSCGNQGLLISNVGCASLFTRGPVNEDVFVGAASTVREMKTMESDIQEITEQIHRLLLQVRWDADGQISRTHSIHFRRRGCLLKH